MQPGDDHLQTRRKPSDRVVLDLRLVGAFRRVFATGTSGKTGPYTLSDYRIQLTPDGSASSEAFFFRDPTAKKDTIQIGGTSYSAD
jgi:hypothetical protein